MPPTLSLGHHSSIPNQFISYITLRCILAIFFMGCEGKNDDEEAEDGSEVNSTKQDQALTGSKRGEFAKRLAARQLILQSR